MTTESTIAVYSIVASTGVALLTWIVAQVIATVAARREVRRQVVARVLDKVDDLVKQQSAPVVLGLFGRKEIDLVLLQTRFALDLRKEDEHIGQWVWAQTQRLLMSNNEKEVTRRAVQIGAGLSMWHQGTLKRSWFSSELEKEPVLEAFDIPRSAKWRQSTRLVKETVLSGLALAGTALLIRQGATILDRD